MAGQPDDCVIMDYLLKICSILLSQVALVVNNLPANAGDIKDKGLIPGLRKSPGGGPGNPLQYSCLENPMDRGVWQVAVHVVIESDRTETTYHTHTNT